MQKFLIAGVTALAMASGAAMAQGLPGTMTQSTEVIHTPSAVAPDYKSTKKEEVIDQHGNTTVKSQTYSTQAGASASTSNSKTIAPDGSVTSQTNEERTTTPLGETTSRSHTITTDR